MKANGMQNRKGRNKAQGRRKKVWKKKGKKGTRNIKN